MALGHINHVEDAVNQKRLRIGQTAAAELSAGKPVLVQGSDPFSRVIAEVFNLLAPRAFRMARSGRRWMTIPGDLNVKFSGLRSLVKMAIIEHSLKFRGGHVLEGM